MTLFEARAKRRTKQWDIARKTGLSQTKISLIERGYVQPSDGEKSKIASALGVNANDIDWQVREDSAA